MKSLRLQILKKTKRYWIKSKIPIALLIIASLVAVPVSLLSPYFICILIDRVMNNSDFGALKIVIAGLIFVYFIRFVVDFINLYCGNTVANRFSFRIRKDIWHKYLKIDFAQYEKIDTGDLKMRMADDVDSLGNFVKDQVVDYISNILLVAVNLAAVLYINWKLALLCLILIPFVFLINRMIGSGSKKVNEKIRLVNDDYYSFVHNALQYWKEIKAQNVEEEFIGRFRSFRKTLAKLGMQSIRYWACGEIFNDFKANYMTQVFIYILGAFFVIQGKLTVGVLISFSQYYATLFTSLDAVNQKNVGLKVNTPYYKRIFEVLDWEVPRRGTAPCPPEEGLDVSEVSFHYGIGESDVLHDINLKIKRNDYTAIVGRSGCGKTTLIKLLLHLYRPQNGTIRIGNIDLNNISDLSLYHHIGVVMQDPFLFNMSIRQNLMVANRGAAEEDMRLACKRVNIMEFIDSLPEKFDTVIGEHGIKLSGGQKQRLVIARTLLKSPELLIFDEATSSLDRISEDIINASIQELAKDTTLLVISHKPETASKARQIIVMEDGRIAAQDTNEEMKKKNAFYRKMAV